MNNSIDFNEEVSFQDLPEAGYEDMDLDNGSYEITPEEASLASAIHIASHVRSVVDNAHYLTAQEKNQLISDLQYSLVNEQVGMLTEEDDNELADEDVEDLEFPESTISPHYSNDFINDYPELDFDEEEDFNPFPDCSIHLTDEMKEDLMNVKLPVHGSPVNYYKPLAEKRTIAMLLMKAHRFEQINEMTRLGFSKSSVDVWIETGNVNNLQLETE